MMRGLEPLLPVCRLIGLGFVLVRAGWVPAESWRGLGLSLLRAGNQVEGQSALRSYLELRPDAPDAALMVTSVCEDGGEARHVAGVHGPVGDATLRGLHLDERLEPHRAARTGPHEVDAGDQA